MMSGSILGFISRFFRCREEFSIEEGSQAASSSTDEKISVIQENVVKALVGTEFVSDGFWIRRAVDLMESGTPEERFCKDTTGLPFTFRIRRKKNGLKTLFIYGNTEICHGGFKIIYSALRIDLDNENVCKVQDYVIQQLKVERMDQNQNIIDSFEAFKRIKRHHQRHGNGERLKVGPKMRLYHYSSPNWRSPLLEISQPRMEGDLLAMTHLPPHEKLNALIDVAEGLLQIHRAGYVHADVKIPNIFISGKNGDRPREGYLSDMDMIRPIGSSESVRIRQPYFAWDHLREYSIYTKNCDIYGLAFSAVDAFLPKFMELLGEGDSKSLIKEAFTKPVGVALINALQCESPRRPEYLTFSSWFESQEDKTIEEIEAKLHELFPIEFQLLNLFAQEFNSSALYYDRVLLRLSAEGEGALLQIIESEAINLNLSSAESLKNEFVAILQRWNP